MRYSPYPVDLKGVFERVLQAVGPGRVIFGTDSSWFPRGFRADILQNQLEVLKSLNVPKEDVQLIMGGNIARLLGLD
jgi:predicted TIM-barrel fold metal-dependent hydrolase